MDKLQPIVERFLKRPGYMERGAGYLAKVFNTTKETIYEAKAAAKALLLNREVQDIHQHLGKVEDLINRKFNNNKGECDLDGIVPERITTLEALIKACNIDTQQWEVLSWECNKWEVGAKNAQNKIEVTPLFQVKAKLARPKAATVFQSEFLHFLSTYQPEVVLRIGMDVAYPRENALLVLPKQDAHFDRVDTKRRDSMADRFQQVEAETLSIVNEAKALHHLKKITYIVGSDQFNSEWTGMTTGGTPQSNVVDYKTAFRLICNHEIALIENLRVHADHVEVLFVPGNHDEYAGWHLAQWLACHYRNVPGVTVTEGDDNDTYRFERFSNAAIMYDHGATCDGKELAQLFPMEFRKEWSQCDHFYIFTGDKHNERSQDVKGIKYFRVPAMTPSKSKWERKRHRTPGEMQAFLIKEDRGLTNMYARLLE